MTGKDRVEQRPRFGGSSLSFRQHTLHDHAGGAERGLFAERSSCSRDVEPRMIAFEVRAKALREPAGNINGSAGRGASARGDKDGLDSHRRPQCDIRTGRVMLVSTVRVVPPSSNSRTRECP